MEIFNYYEQNINKVLIKQCVYYNQNDNRCGKPNFINISICEKCILGKTENEN